MQVKTAGSQSTRQKVAPINGGVQLSQRTGRNASGEILIPELITREPMGPFGFSHLGAAGGGADQYVYIGDSEGDIATILSLSATAFDNPIGCYSNAVLNRTLKHYPVVVDKIVNKVSNLNQQSKAIYYCVLQPDGEVHKTNITRYFRSEISEKSEQNDTQTARFNKPIVLGPQSCLLYYVDDTYTLESNLHPVGSKQ
jgi:hypothetical protein